MFDPIGGSEQRERVGGPVIAAVPAHGSGPADRRPPVSLTAALAAAGALLLAACQAPPPTAGASGRAAAVSTSSATSALGSPSASTSAAIRQPTAAELSSALSRIGSRVVRFGSPTPDQVKESKRSGVGPDDMEVRQTWTVRAPIETVAAWYHDRYAPDGAEIVQGRGVMDLTTHVDVTDATTPLDGATVQLYFDSLGSGSTAITVVVDGVARPARTPGSLLDVDDIVSGSLVAIPNTDLHGDTRKTVTLTRADVRTVIALLNRADAQATVISMSTMGGWTYNLVLVTREGRALHATTSTNVPFIGVVIDFDPSAREQRIKNDELLGVFATLTGTS